MEKHAECLHAFIPLCFLIVGVVWRLLQAPDTPVSLPWSRHQKLWAKKILSPLSYFCILVFCHGILSQQQEKKLRQCLCIQCIVLISCIPVKIRTRLIILPNTEKEVNKRALRKRYWLPRHRNWRVEFWGPPTYFLKNILGFGAKKGNSAS